LGDWFWTGDLLSAFCRTLAMQLQLETSSSGLKGENELASTRKASTATIHQAS
jgi:hypothetical protein